MKHALVLPTNRDCAHNLAAFFGEGIFARDSLGKDVEIVIVDTADRPTRERHAASVSAFAHKIGVHHMDVERMDRFLDGLLELSDTAPAERADLKRLLDPKVCSYGAAANKTFLMAAAIGAECVHRRDSDTVPQLVGGKPLYPFEIEAGSLGKPIMEMEGVMIERDFAPDPETRHLPLTLCGGNYLGEWAADLKGMYASNPEAFFAYLSLGVPETRRQEVKGFLTERYLDQEAKLYGGDRLELVSRKIIEVGNHAIYRIFLTLPLIHSTNATSTDYFYHNVLAKLRIPMLYHNRHLIHAHTPERKIASWFSEYHLRIVKHRVAYVYINEILDHLSTGEAPFSADEPGFNPSAFSAAIGAALGKDLEADMDAVLDEITGIFTSIGSSEYAELGSTLSSRRKALKSEVDDDFRDYARLVSAWPRLIRSAPAAFRRLNARA